jgi:hypothetical protein
MLRLWVLWVLWVLLVPLCVALLVHRGPADADPSTSLAARCTQSATLVRELALQQWELSRRHALERASREAKAAALTN